MKTPSVYLLPKADLLFAFETAIFTARDKTGAGNNVSDAAAEALASYVYDGFANTAITPNPSHCMRTLRRHRIDHSVFNWLADSTHRRDLTRLPPEVNLALKSAIDQALDKYVQDHSDKTIA